MSNIPIRDLTQTGVPVASSYIVFDDGVMRRGLISDLADGVRPVASQGEAEAGANNAKVMTPLRAKQSIAAEVGASIQGYSANLAGFAGKAAPAGAVVGTTDTQTLTNKTLTSPAINLGVISARDSQFAIVDDADTSKQLNFQLSGITTATARVLTVPDANTTIVGTDTTQALTNKTYNGNIWTAGTGTLTLAAGKTATVSNTLTFTGTDGSSAAFGAGGTVAYKGTDLSQFAATTSLQLKGVISDETGSGALVFATSPALAGIPTAPTAAASNNSTQVATTAYVDNQVSAGVAGVSSLGSLTGVITVDGGNLASNVLTVVRYDAAQSLSAGQQTQARNNINATSIGRAINGLVPSNNAATPNTKLDISPGNARDKDLSIDLVMATGMTKTTSAFATGTGNGGLDTGSIAVSTGYHIHLIYNPTTLVTEPLFSTSATAPTMPAGYTKSRRIGGFITDASGFIVKGLWRADGSFEMLKEITVAAARSLTLQSLLTLPVPLGVKLKANTRCLLNDTGGGNPAFYGMMSDPDIGARTLTVGTEWATAFAQKNLGTAWHGVNECWTNASGQVYTWGYSATSSATMTIFVYLMGWTDLRDEFS